MAQMPAVRSPVGCTAKIARRSLIQFYAFRRLDEAEPRGAYYVVLSAVRFSAPKGQDLKCDLTVNALLDVRCQNEARLS